MKTFIASSFWSDRDIEGCDATTKLTALWLITNSQTSILGICSVSDARFKLETGLEPEGLQRALEALPRAFTKVGDSIFIRNFIRHQFGTGDKLMKNNFFVSLKSAFLSVKDSQLRDEILSEYAEFGQALTKPFEGLTKPQGKEREGKDGEKRVKGEKQIDETFAQFWTLYPKKLAKLDAEKAWTKHKCSEILPQILSSLEIAMKDESWKKDEGKFIPHPASWLNAKRWEDERIASRPSESKPSEPPAWKDWLVSSGIGEVLQGARSKWEFAPPWAKDEFREHQKQLRN